MKTYIIFLRAVNVAGKNLIKMEDLKIVLQENGYREVKTYIQSGNIALQSNQKQEQIAQEIKHLLLQHFQLQIEVFVLTKEELLHALEHNPWGEDLPGNMVYLTFLSQEIAAKKWDLLLAFAQAREVLEVKNKVLYFYTPIGAGKSKISNALIESKLKVLSTMRNRNTVEKMLTFL